MGLRKGVCPNCNSTEIYVGTNRAAGVTASQYGIGRLQLNWRHSAAIKSFVCTTCGYLENYVVANDKLLKIRELWVPVNGEPDEKPKNDEKRKNDEL